MLVTWNRNDSIRKGQQSQVVLQILIASSILINVLNITLPKEVIIYAPSIMSTIPRVKSFSILWLRSKNIQFVQPRQYTHLNNLPAEYSQRQILKIEYPDNLVRQNYRLVTSRFCRG